MACKINKSFFKNKAEACETSSTDAQAKDKGRCSDTTEQCVDNKQNLIRLCDERVKQLMNRRIRRATERVRKTFDKRRADYYNIARAEKMVARCFDEPTSSNGKMSKIRAEGGAMSAMASIPAEARETVRSYRTLSEEAIELLRGLRARAQDTATTTVANMACSFMTYKNSTVSAAAFYSIELIRMVINNVPCVTDFVFKRIQQLLEFVSQYITHCRGQVRDGSEPSAIQAEAGDSERLTKSTISSIGNCVTWILTGDDLGDEKKFKRKLDHYGSLFKNLTFITTGVEKLTTLSNWFFNEFAPSMFARVCASWTLREVEVPVLDERVQLKDFVSDVMELCVHDLARFKDEKYIERLHKVYRQASWLATSIVDKKLTLTSLQATTVNNAIQTVMRFYSTNHVFIKYPLTGSRDTPFAIQLVGPPASGKSTAANGLVKTIMAPQMCVKTYPPGSVYSLSQCKHWDGFTNQKAIIIDDIAQQKGAPGSEESDTMQYIRLISNTAFITPQASLEAKGMPCTSDLVVSTTNTAFPEFKELRDSDAYYRRRDLYRQERVSGIWKEYYERSGIDAQYFKDYDSYVFFFIPDKTNDKGTWLRLSNALRLEPLSVQNIEKYRRDFGAMCWPEFIQKTSRDFNKHLRCPDPEFTRRDVTANEFEVYKREVIINSEVAASVPLNSGVNAEGALLSKTDDRVTYDCVGLTYCCVPRNWADIFDQHYERPYEGPFVRYCYAMKRAYYYGCRRDDRMRLFWVDIDSHMTEQMREDVFYMRLFCEPGRDEESCRISQQHQNRELIECGKYDGCRECGSKRSRGCDFEDTSEWENAEYDPRVQPINTRVQVHVEQDESSEDDDPDNVLIGPDVEVDPDDWDDNNINAEAEVLDGVSTWVQTVADYLKVTVEELYVLLTSMPSYIWSIIGCCFVLGTAVAAYQLYKFMSSEDEEKQATMSRVLLDIPDVIKEDVLDYVDNARAEANLVEAIVVNESKKKKSYREVSATVDAHMLAEAGHAYDANVRTKAHATTRLRPQTVNKIVAQAYVGQTNAREVGSKIAMGNLLYVQARFDPNNGIGFRVLGTGGRTVVFPGHAFRAIQVAKECEISIFRRGIKFENIDIDFTTAVAIDEYDLYIVQLPKKFPMMGPIKDHIQTLDEESTSADRYIYFSYNAETKTELIERSSGVMCHEEHYSFDAGIAKLDCKILNGYRLPIWYGVGHCGSFIVNESTGKVCGMHVAGNPGVGMTYFAPLTQEMLDMAVGEEPVEDATEAEASLIVSSKGSRIMEQTGVVEVIGVVGPDYHQQPPNVNKWKATKLGGHESPMFPIRKEPSVMSLRDERVAPEVKAEGRSPLQLGLDKSSVQPIEFSPETIEKAVKAVKRVLGRMPLGKVGKRLLSQEEQINGVIGPAGEGRWYDGMDMKTAVGVPYRAEAASTRLPGKSAFFEERATSGPAGEKLYDVRMHVGGVATGAKMMDRLNTSDQLLRNGKLPFYVNAMNLKMETLKLSKIASAGTRSFECLPLHITMLVRKYFGAFFETLQVNSDMYPVSVGVAAQKGGWTRLGKRLKRFGGQVIAGDYKQWDGKLMPCIMRAAIEVVNDWYGDEPNSPEALARICLAETHSHGYVAAVNMLFRRHGGMPSGSPMTSPINSICNWLNILCAIIDIMEKKGHAVSIEKLITDVELAVYGDDHIAALGPEFLGKVTFRDFYELFNKLGLGYTDSVKSVNIDFDYEHLEETTYLKRKFVPYKGYYLAPLDIVSIENMPLWWEARNRCREIDVINEKKISFVEELGMHTRDVYNEHVQIWNDHVQKLKDQGSLVCEEGRYPYIDDEHEYVQGEILKGIVSTL
ncbi:putative polyprotein [Linepithema humile picorna-like virus 4]|nr:putative polyprotein [Linepithema humile picorna-like virus 4]